MFSKIKILEKNEIGQLPMTIGDHSAGGTWRLQRMWFIDPSFPPTPCEQRAAVMARGKGMIGRGKEVVGRGKGAMTTLDWSLSFDSLRPDTKLGLFTYGIFKIGPYWGKLFTLCCQM